MAAATVSGTAEPGLSTPASGSPPLGRWRHPQPEAGWENNWDHAQRIQRFQRLAPYSLV